MGAQDVVRVLSCAMPPAPLPRPPAQGPACLPRDLPSWLLYRNVSLTLCDLLVSGCQSNGPAAKFRNEATFASQAVMDLREQPFSGQQTSPSVSRSRQP